jgi:small subunit ribosomal protein S3
MGSERKFLQENMRRVLLKEYLVEQTKRAGFGGVTITRTPMGTRVTLVCERPGVIIGRRGEYVRALTETIAKDFKLDNPQIEVQEEKKPNLNAQLMAEKLAVALERGWHFRRAGHSTVRRIMESGARGCQVILSGKLTGERHRTERFKAGTIKYCGTAAIYLMKKGFCQARLKPGVIGVVVWIMPPDAKMPDEVSVAGKPVIVAQPPVLPPEEPEIEPLPPAAEDPGDGAPTEELK